MKISVIVPIYNALDEVKELLESLNKNFNFYMGEILLINDCSKEETSSYLLNFAKENPQYKLINNEQNLGFIKTCNKGIIEADGDIIVLLNSDTIIPKGFAERIIKCFNSDNKIGIASPISSFSGNHYIPLKKNYSLEDMNKRLRKKHKCVYPLIPDAEGFCYCIKKDVIINQGYLDEIYGIGYCEETDYAYRAWLNGWKNVLIDDLYVYHKRNCSFGENSRSEQKRKNEKILHSRYQIWANILEKDKNRQITRKIEREMFFENPFFSIKSSVDNKHKIINILGIKLKLINKISPLT